MSVGFTFPVSQLSLLEAVMLSGPTLKNILSLKAFRYCQCGAHCSLLTSPGMLQTTVRHDAHAERKEA